MLTDKQEKFVLGLVSGMSQREAYRAAYDASRMKDATVDSRARELFKGKEVRERFDALHDRVLKEAENAAVATAVEVLEGLTDIAMGKRRFPCVDKSGNEFEQPPSVGERLRALELLGKRHRLFTEPPLPEEPVKIELGDNLKEYAD